MLAATGVLKLIDQQVADARPPRRAAASVGRPSSALSQRGCDLARLQCSPTEAASANTTLSWAAAWRSSVKAGADDLPFIFGVVGRREFQNNWARAVSRPGMALERLISRGFCSSRVWRSRGIRGERLTCLRNAEPPVSSSFARTGVCASCASSRIRSGTGRKEIGELGQLKVKLVARIVRKAERAPARAHSLAAPGTWLKEVVEGGERCADGVGDGWGMRHQRTYPKQVTTNLPNTHSRSAAVLQNISRDRKERSE